MSGVKLQTGASLNSIAKCEESIGFIFPQDFIELYQQVDGFEEFDWNEHMFSLWSLEKIIREYQADGTQNYIGFCDFLINSHSIGFFKSDPGIYKSYDQTEPIATTFAEAIEMINVSSDKIY